MGFAYAYEYTYQDREYIIRNMNTEHAQLVREPGVYIRWNGMVEWNSGMDYWNGGMLHRTYLIIQHVLYSEQ